MILQVENVDAFYGIGHILHGLSLNVADSEVVALLGRNGAGKTTTLRCIAGLTPPRRGAIRYQGRSIAGDPPHRIARMGIALVPETRDIFSYLTVKENLVIGQRAGSRWRMETVLERFPRLAERLAHKGRELSGGEQQMLAIGRALVTNPHLLILDEATEGLAPLVREEIWRCLATLRAAGQTILVIDKYIERLVRLADRHTIIERGRVAWRGTSAELDADRGLWHRYLGV